VDADADPGEPVAGGPDAGAVDDGDVSDGGAGGGADAAGGGVAGVAGAEGAGSTGGADVQLDCRHGLSPPGPAVGVPGAGRSSVGGWSSAADSGDAPR
jgi:hypothetical protein